MKFTGLGYEITNIVVRFCYLAQLDSVRVCEFTHIQTELLFFAVPFLHFFSFLVFHSFLFKLHLGCFFLNLIITAFGGLKLVALSSAITTVQGEYFKYLIDINFMLFV